MGIKSHPAHAGLAKVVTVLTAVLGHVNQDNILFAACTGREDGPEKQHPGISANKLKQETKISFNQPCANYREAKKSVLLPNATVVLIAEKDTKNFSKSPNNHVQPFHSHPGRCRYDRVSAPSYTKSRRAR